MPIQVLIYQDTQGQACDNWILDGDGGELKLPNLARKSLSEGTEGVLAYAREYGRPRNVP